MYFDQTKEDLFECLGISPDRAAQIQADVRAYIAKVSVTVTMPHTSAVFAAINDIVLPVNAEEGFFLAWYIEQRKKVAERILGGLQNTMPPQ